MNLTPEDITQALTWLRKIEVSARMKKQKDHEQAAAHAAKVITELSGR